DDLHHLELHSFPTRRSSDLHGVGFPSVERPAVARRWEEPRMTERPDRNLAMELVRVTEAAALAAGRWIGHGDKNAADQAAVDAIDRKSTRLNSSHQIISYAV